MTCAVSLRSMRRSVVIAPDHESGCVAVEMYVDTRVESGGANEAAQCFQSSVGSKLGVALRELSLERACSICSVEVTWRMGSGGVVCGVVVWLMKEWLRVGVA
eukprot:6474382-Amphidinium_carterae.1